MSLLGAISQHYVDAAADLTPIGRDPAAGSNLSAFSSRCIWTDIAAVENGTITNVRADAAVAGHDIAFFTISSTNVVRAITANITPAAGVNDYAVSLAVQTGDRIGAWIDQTPAVSSIRLKDYGGAGTWYRLTTGTAKPTAGTTLTPNSTGSAGQGLAMLATGTQ